VPFATAAPITVALRSSAIHGSTLPALYTCDARNISPPLSWSRVPSGVHELALFAIGTQRDRGGQVVRTVEWAMAGVQPGLRDLRAGEVPRGAFVLVASDGRGRYSICPPRGQTGRYTFALYALPRVARASAAISGAGLLHNLTESAAEYEAPVSGTFSVTYTRR
jgi:hypothetical protein